MELQIKVDQFDIYLDLTFKIDLKKFTEEKAKSVNEFWGDSERRLVDSGSHRMAALKLYAAECFKHASFNNFKDEEYVESCFMWDSKSDTEGFWPFAEVGLKLTQIDNFHFDYDAISAPNDLDFDSQE